MVEKIECIKRSRTRRTKRWHMPLSIIAGFSQCGGQKGVPWRLSGSILVHNRNLRNGSVLRGESYRRLSGHDTAGVFCLDLWPCSREAFQLYS
jgi:hypothetical protein